MSTNIDKLEKSLKFNKELVFKLNNKIKWLLDNGAVNNDPELKHLMEQKRNLESKITIITASLNQASNSLSKNESNYNQCENTLNNNQQRYNTLLEDLKNLNDEVEESIKEYNRRLNTNFGRRQGKQSQSKVRRSVHH